MAFFFSEGFLGTDLLLDCLAVVIFFIFHLSNGNVVPAIIIALSFYVYARYEIEVSAQFKSELGYFR